MTIEYEQGNKVYFAFKKSTFSKSKMAADSHIEIEHICDTGHCIGENISVTHNNGMFQSH